MSRRQILIVVVFTTGCGSPGSGTFYPADRPVVPASGNKFAPSAPGQVSEYTFRLDNKTNGVHAEGTLRQLTTNYSDVKIPSGISVTIDMQSTSRTQYGLPIEPIAVSTSLVYVNDTEGYPSLIRAKSLNGVIKYSASPEGGYQADFPGGVVAVGDSFSSGPVTFSDSSGQSCTHVVTASENMDAPLARFACFKCESSCTFNELSGTIVFSETYWVHTSVGLVKSVSTSQGPNGFVELTIELVSTNVPF